MLFDNPEKLVPDQILDWLDFCSHRLWQTRQLIFSALPSGVLPPRISAAAESLVQLTASEIDEYFDYCQLELDLFTILALLASMEAKIRMDAKKRYRTKGNKLSNRLSILFRKTKQLWKVPLYESGILEEWKRYIQTGLSIPSSDKNRLVGDIGKFKELLRIRNWVAHGRYWPLQLNIRKYPPQFRCRGDRGSPAGASGCCSPWKFGRFSLNLSSSLRFLRATGPATL